MDGVPNSNNAMTVVSKSVQVSIGWNSMRGDIMIPFKGWFGIH